MPIAKKRHNLKAKDGVSNVFIIRDKTGQTRKLAGVSFLEGEGVTRHAPKALWFDEQMDYEVVLPRGYPAWELASSEEAVHGEEWSEDGRFTEDEDGEYEDE